VCGWWRRGQRLALDQTHVLGPWNVTLLRVPVGEELTEGELAASSVAGSVAATLAGGCGAVGGGGGSRSGAGVGVTMADVIRGRIVYYLPLPLPCEKPLMRVSLHAGGRPAEGAKGVAGADADVGWGEGAAGSHAGRGGGGGAGAGGIGGGIGRGAGRAERDTPPRRPSLRPRRSPLICNFSPLPSPISPIYFGSSSPMGGVSRSATPPLTLPLLVTSSPPESVLSGSIRSSESPRGVPSGTDDGSASGTRSGGDREDEKERGGEGESARERERERKRERERVARQDEGADGGSNIHTEAEYTEYKEDAEQSYLEIEPFARIAACRQIPREVRGLLPLVAPVGCPRNQQEERQQFEQQVIRERRETAAAGREGGWTWGQRERFKIRVTLEVGVN
jgi:hypothetical protein